MKIHYYIGLGLTLMCSHYSGYTQQTHHVVVTINQPPQLIANAGEDIGDSPNLDVTIGGTPSASGGTSPYTYTWSPSTNLSDPLSANPILGLIASAESYTLTVTDARGCHSEDIMDVLVSIVSVEGGERKILVYPNPASRQLTIELAEKAGNFFVYDNAGRLVMEEQVSSLKHQLNLSSLSRGLYYLKIKQGKKFQIVKLLIQ